MEQMTPCKNCQFKFSITQERCPHCGKDHTPNVEAANLPDEVASLEHRYTTAIQSAQDPGALSRVMAFEEKCRSSKAVMARYTSMLLELAHSDSNGYPTFHSNVASGKRLPSGDKWDLLRRRADSAFFPFYEEQIRFAALSLDGLGLSNYGECSIILKESMIQHRTTVFEKNSVIFLKDKNLGYWDDLPTGYRATWDRRHILCTAKLAARIDSKTEDKHFSELLLKPGPDSASDEFVEVHIFGNFTIRTVERVIIRLGIDGPEKIMLDILRDKLSAFKIPLEVR